MMGEACLRHKGKLREHFAVEMVRCFSVQADHFDGDARGDVACSGDTESGIIFQVEERDAKTWNG